MREPLRHLEGRFHALAMRCALSRDHETSGDEQESGVHTQRWVLTKQSGGSTSFPQPIGVASILFQLLGLQVHICQVLGVPTLSTLPRT